MRYYIETLADVEACTIASGGCPAVLVENGYVELDVNKDFRHQSIIDTYKAEPAPEKKTTKKLKEGK